MRERRDVFDRSPEELLQRFLRLTVNTEKGSVSSRLFVPECGGGGLYPLVIYMHGAGERGEDNEVQVLVSRGATAFASPESQAAHPCFVLAPQVKSGGSPLLPEFEEPFLETLRRVAGEYPVDRDRIYITGASMGGVAVWHYITRYSELFAAAVPVCGAGEPDRVGTARHVPVWAFHSADDPVIPADGSRDFEQFGLEYGSGSRVMTEALRSCGGTARYTEYPKGYIAERFGLPKAYAGHFAAEPAYQEPELAEWLFNQKKRTAGLRRRIDSAANL